MANSAIEVAKKEASMKMAAQSRRFKTKGLENTLIRKGAVFGTAAIYGTLNRFDVPVAIGGFPWKLGINALALLGEGMTSGRMQATFAGISDATTAIYVERSITENTLIVGEGYDDDEDPEAAEV